MTLLEVGLGAAAGAAAAPLVRLLADRFTIGQIRPARTARGKTVLIGACVAAGAAVSTLTGTVTTLTYALFAGVVLAIALVDSVELRIPDRLVYPLLFAAIVGLPWLSQPLTWKAAVAPLAGAAASAGWEFVMALAADHGPGDVKLAAVIGAWMAHLGLLPWIAGLLLGQISMIAVLGDAIVRRRKTGVAMKYTPLGPALAVGAVLAVAVAGNAW